MPRLPGSGAILLLLSILVTPALRAQEVHRYVRFERGGEAIYGLLEGRQIRPIRGDLFGEHQVTGERVPLDQVTLLAPVTPSKVIAVGLNYQSHLGERDPAAYPGLFAKYPTCIVGPEEAVVRPPDSRNLHYEGEMVLVMGKEARDVPMEEAGSYVFGVTVGNDISERDWQAADLQWLRAKASDTFGPVGPMVVTGLDFNDLHIQTRVNGEVRQEARTSQLIFNVAEIVSYVSRYVTLYPGDIIFTGTPGSTRAMEPGDLVEVELEGVGVLRNPIVQGGEGG
jgi:2-keto-4-pentenoate hydratase/2-oxohepta-3-ene-1,7-dioic acid hydratase in catechol pathway